MPFAYISSLSDLASQIFLFFVLSAHEFAHLFHVLRSSFDLLLVQFELCDLIGVYLLEGGHSFLVESSLANDSLVLDSDGELPDANDGLFEHADYHPNFISLLSEFELGGLVLGPSCFPSLILLSFQSSSGSSEQIVGFA